MKFHHIGSVSERTEQTRFYASSVEPLSEGILGRSFRKIKDAVVTVVAATLFFTSVGSAYNACSPAQNAFENEQIPHGQCLGTIPKTQETQEHL